MTENEQYLLNALKIAQAHGQLMIAQAVKDGKVQTIIIPSNLTALGNIGGK